MNTSKKREPISCKACEQANKTLNRFIAYLLTRERSSKNRCKRIVQSSFVTGVCKTTENAFIFSLFLNDLHFNHSIILTLYTYTSTAKHRSIPIKYLLPIVINLIYFNDFSNILQIAKYEIFESYIKVFKNLDINYNVLFRINMP